MTAFFFSSSRRPAFFAATLTSALLTMSGCAPGEGEGDGLVYEDGESTTDDDNQALAPTAVKMTGAQRLARLKGIRDEAVYECIAAGWTIAGIAESETRLAHCYSERDSQACKGPVSEECDGGAIIAGYWDGPCANKQGGLGMFQFDGGTHSQTIKREGERILTVAGSTEAAFEFIETMLKGSRFVSINNEIEAAEFLSRMQIDSTDYKNYIKSLVVYYNGCDPDRSRNPCARSTYNARYNEYDTAMHRVVEETASIEDFWTFNEAEAERCFYDR